MFLVRRKSVAVAATGIVAALVVAGMPANANAGAEVDGLQAATAATILPSRLAATADGSFIVQLKAAPLAGKSVRDKAAARAAILGAQTPVIDAAKKLGLTVGARYADAINGFAVTGSGRAVSALAKNPGVASVSQSTQYQVDNSAANSLTGAASTWTDTGFTGKGIKVAILDSGVDYFHATFGGAGKAAYDADDSTIVEPGTFPTAKVIGGQDFVGDAYDARYYDPSDPATAAFAPKPDADPRDCSVFNGTEATAGGHGSHVAGTAAGYGVNSDGTTFKGPWNSTSNAGLAIGSGSAPEASILAYRVFGCNGSTNSDVVIAAINAAVAAGAGVINMSLGSSFGRLDNAYNTAIGNAVKAGTVVVASAGNSGPEPYITGSPAASKAALSVAAIDARPEVDTYVATLKDDGAKVPVLPTLSTGTPVAEGTMAPVGDWSILLTSTSQYVASVTRLGCNASDYLDADGNSLVAGKIAVVQRGACTFGQKQANMVAAGAVMGIIVNRHDTGTDFVSMSGVTNAIPMVAAAFYASKALQNAGSSTQAFWGSSLGRVATFGPGKFANPSFTYAASFTSGGPRYGDAGFKPDIAAPGVSVRSAAVGTGTDYEDFSGTSMAAPHTAGSVALVRQAHPDWTAAQVKAAMVNTASRSASVLAQDTRITGNGLVQPKAAIANGVLVYPASLTKDGDTSLSFGVREAASTVKSLLTIANRSGASQTVTLSSLFEGSPAGASMTFSPSSVTLAAGFSATVTATLTLDSTYMSSRGTTSSTGVIKTMYGQVIATRGDGLTSTVPFNAVPLSRSAISAKASGSTVTLKNDGLASGGYSVAEWLMSDKQDTPGGIDLRSVGVRTTTEAAIGLSSSTTKKFHVFSLTTHNMIFNAADTQWYLDIDTTGDGKVDFEIFAYDQGVMGGSSANGKVGFYLYYKSPVDGEWYGKTGAYSLFTGINASTLQFGIAQSTLCAGLETGTNTTTGEAACSADQTLKFRVVEVGAVDYYDNYDYINTISGTVDPASPLVNHSSGGTLAAGASASFTLTPRAPLAGETRTLGWMIVMRDNRSGLQSTEIRRF